MRKGQSFVLINLGLLLVAAGVHFFKVPNHFAIGGVSGLAIIFDSFFPEASVGQFMLVINTLLLLIGFLLVGTDFTSKTAYSSFALSGFVWLFQYFFPMTQPFTQETMLELCMAIIFPAVGTAIVFNQGASTGGTDIVAKILSNLTSIDIGKSLLLADCAITILAGVVFGIRIGMYSFLGLIIKAFLIDMVIEGLNLRKQFVIISTRSEEIITFITHNLHRGATVHTAFGAFTHDAKQVITTVVSRPQAIALRNYIRSIDPKAFITITNTSEIIGKGFRGF
ncbi:MAG TPA: YitT family protein [Bacillota bacterium]|nr:YitT family protein [Bacillota bacterium]